MATKTIRKATRKKPNRSARSTALRASRSNGKLDRRSRVAAAPLSAPPEPDQRRALRTVMELMAIPGPSGQEGKVVAYIIDKLRRAGASAAAIRTDHANKKTPLAGEVGNLIFKLPGTVAGPRRLLMAHVDTVPICVGARPLRKGDWIESANKESGLGADDRAGAAAVLTAAVEILERKLPHPPLTFFWPVQEEVGLYGARKA
jgi:tripeptide aminopeptidase